MASHEGISSTSEPWLLIPAFYALRRTGVDAEYQHQELARAVADLIDELPRGSEDYADAVQDFALGIYEKLSAPEDLYFLDKTPHYSLIAKEIIQTFPEGKFIFLWRNPLATIASMFETWPGFWVLSEHYADLVQGLSNLIMCSHEWRDRIVTLRYEDLVAYPERELRRVLDYLDLPYQSNVLENFGDIHFRGRMGDRWGSQRYVGISTDPLDKWQAALSSPLRKWWCRRYLRWLGPERLEAMGYDSHLLLSELKAAPVKASSIVGDFRRLGRSFRRATLTRSRFRRPFRMPPS